MYSALGSQITVVEMMDQLIPGADKDLVKPLQQHLKKTIGADIKLKAKVTECKAQKSGLKVTFDGDDSEIFDRVLVAVMPA